MDSHEEKVYLAVRQTQEREAKQKMREKAKELQRQRLEISKRGISIGGRNYGGSSGGSSEGFGSTGGISSSSVPASISVDIRPTSKPAPVRNALKLGGKSKDVDSFVDQLKNEGEKISNQPILPTTAAVAASRPKPAVPTERYGIILLPMNFCI